MRVSVLWAPLGGVSPKGDLLTGSLVHDVFGRVTADGNARYAYDGADRTVTRGLANGANTDRYTYLAGGTATTSDGVARYATDPAGTRSPPGAAGPTPSSRSGPPR